MSSKSCGSRSRKEERRVYEVRTDHTMNDDKEPASGAALLPTKRYPPVIVEQNHDYDRAVGGAKVALEYIRTLVIAS